MTVASAQTLRRLRPVNPFVERNKEHGVTYGCGPAGYDIRIAQDVELYPGTFILASAMEEFRMPHSLLGIVHDKSSWARKGLSVFNTVIEPGWRGYLTLELANHSSGGMLEDPIRILKGSAIAQVVFMLLDEPTDTPYPEDGKYQDQKEGPQPAIFEGSRRPW